jgi:hypothetical protein
MSGWTVAWIVWIVLFFAIELPAVFNRCKGDTLSEHVWHWCAVREKSRGYRLRRTALLVLLAWLVAHFLTGGEF